MADKLMPKLKLLNPREHWVRSELEKLTSEWEAWAKQVEKIKDHPYDQQRESEVYKDGRANMLAHKILQEKTRVFLDNNVDGHNFIRGFDGNHIDRTDLRLKIRVEHRLDDLYVLRGAIQYAQVPEGYWVEKAKELVDKMSDKGSDAAISLVASYLKNPGQ